MMEAEQPSRPSSLLLTELPDPCLVAVVQCCAADSNRSLFSAARAHSRLHQAAVSALRSRRTVVTQQQQADGVLLYLRKHGRHVDNVDLEVGLLQGRFPTVTLRQLPPNLELRSLQLDGFNLQLQPGVGFQGVLGPGRAAALKQLRLRSCELSYEGTAEALAAALSQLPSSLEHLSIERLYHKGYSRVQFPTAVLQQLQQLTSLELADVRLQGPCQGSLALQPLQALSRLVDLRVSELSALPGSASLTPAADRISASMLSGTNHLTRLELIARGMSSSVEVEPGALAGKSHLQHLNLGRCKVPGGAAGVAELLSHLQQVQQLTHLVVRDSLSELEEGNPPAAAYSALTASSKLQHLDIRGCRLPSGVWEHLFPAGRQLPHLQYLDISCVKHPDGSPYPAPDGSLLASCCPGLCCLSLNMLQCNAEQLAPLQGLSGLHTLYLDSQGPTGDVLEALCQLTGLMHLDALVSCPTQEELRQLTQLEQLTGLKQLTTLEIMTADYGQTVIMSEAPGDEPVWRQLLRHIADP